MSLRSRVHQSWNELKRGKPGRRFQDRFDRNRRERGRSVGKRVLKIVAAVALLLLGLVEILLPGPAVLFIFAGAALLAGESRTMARLMDALEVQGRRLWRAVRERWRTASPGSRGAVVSLLAAMAAVSGLLVYRVFAG